MVVTDVGNTTTTDMENYVTDYSVSEESTDGVSGNGEARWSNDDWAKQLGYYKQIPELQKAIQALAIWTVGKGYTADDATKVSLGRMRGWGEDDFIDILRNLLITKKIGGDAFAEIIRNDNGTLINLKPLDPNSITVVVSSQGIIKRYEQTSKISGNNPKKFRPEEIFHICNDRIADEIHGTSVIDACEWTILARNEAMSDKKRVHHRSTIRVIEIDSDDTTKLAALKTQYQNAINKGEVMIVPKDNVQFPDVKLSYLDTQEWIRYLENFFYQAVGVPKVMVATEGTTESGGKIGFLTFEPTYTAEQVSLESDLWNQLAIKITFNRPPSLGGDLQRDEAKDPNAIQPNDTQAGVGQ